MKRTVLRTYSGAFSAVGATTGNVEGSDYVEHFFFKAICGRFVLNTGVGVIENTLLAGASGTSIATCVAADTLRKLVLPESESLVGSHSLDTSDLIKSAGLDYISVLAEKLIISNVLLALAVYATLSQNVAGVDKRGLVSVKGGYSKALTLCLDRADTLSGNSLYLGDISHTLTGDAYCIDLFAVKAVLGKELVEAIGIAGLEEHENLSLTLCGFFDQIFGEV